MAEECAATPDARTIPRCAAVRRREVFVMRFLMMQSARVAALSLLAVCACRGKANTTAPAATPVRLSYASGDDLIAAMRERYAGKWYTTLTFTQKTSRLVAEKWNVQTWYEAMSMPGKLRIDFEPISAGNGVLYVRDSAFAASNGRALRGQPSINPLLLLGFDVYANTPARTATLLRREGYDLTKVATDTFQGRPMIVVGAAPTGTKINKRFWIDAERLYFVRSTDPAPRDSTKVQDVRFMNYQRQGEAWIAPRVEIHTDGKLVFYEDYTDIRVNVELDPALFDPAKWKAAKHWVTK